MKLLLIEDDRNVADMLATAFRDEGHTTTVKHSGEAGLSQLGLERPDAVVLDVLLPKMNGIEVLRHIRASDPTLPVIIVSGFATPGQLDEARRAAASRDACQARHAAGNARRRWRAGTGAHLRAGLQP